MFIVAQTVQAETVETQVAVQDHVLIYDGPLSPEANARAAELLKQSDKIDTLKINSRGGEIGLGIDLGNLVFDHQLNVEVGQYCFSSCANYVFPAGKVKYLNLRNHGSSMEAVVNYCNLTVPNGADVLRKNWLNPCERYLFFRKSKFSKVKPLQGRRLNMKNITLGRLVLYV